MLLDCSGFQPLYVKMYKEEVFVVSFSTGLNTKKSSGAWLLRGIGISSNLILCKFAQGRAGDSSPIIFPSSVNFPSSVKLRRDRSPRQAIH